MVLLRGSARQMERGVAYKLYVMVGSRKYIPLRSHVRIVTDVLVTGSHLEATGRRSPQDVKIIDAKYFHCVLQSSVVFPFICCR